MSILVVPGLHPMISEAVQHLIYDTALGSWRREGHEVLVYQFGWQGDEDLPVLQARLNKVIQSLPDPAYAIGVSAGGLAAILALRDNPDKIQRVVTIASPLKVPDETLDGLRARPRIPGVLGEVYRTSDDYLRKLDTWATTRIVSMHGRSDARVRPAWSQREYITDYELPGRIHGLTILGALTVHREEVQKLLSGNLEPLQHSTVIE